MRALHWLVCLPLAVMPLASFQKPTEKPAASPGAVSTQVLAPLEQLAHTLAKGARERELKDLLAALAKFDYPKANLEKLEKSCKDELARAKSPLDSSAAGAKQLRQVAKQIVAILNKMEPGEEKEALARKILMLDGECVEAHQALGHELVGSSWVPPDQKDLRQRRGLILMKIAEAKKLPVEIEVGQVDDEYIQRACGVKATMVRRGQYELHTNFSAEKSTRILREVSRAWAMSNWLRRVKPKDPDTMDLPPNPKGTFNRNVWVMIDSLEKYRALGKALVAEGKLGPDAAKLWAGPDDYVGTMNVVDGPRIVLAQFEAPTQADLLVAMSGMREGLHTAVTAGHLNYLTLSFFGCLLPSYIIKEGGERKFGGTTVETEEQKREREELLRLAKSGIAGSRTWMQYLAERNEDPAWANSFVDALGDVAGNDLHKCTSVVEFLQESNMLGSLLKKLRVTEGGRKIEQYVDALGMPLGEFESKWRTWLLGNRPGVAERIDKENLDAWPKDALALLDYMNAIREATFKGKIEGVWKLKFDPNLSEQCALHAHYLTLHPEQQKWPDAHEEYADKEGYTPEGAWAGLQSVIVWGDFNDYKGAVDVWMGSFYHRLPLIDPGVLRLGWGSEDIYAVMDMSSLAVPYEKPYLVLYPYDKQNDVPVAFVGNEMPDPVPDGTNDVNEAEILGYPITLQTNPVDERGEPVYIDMKLYIGDEEVPCHFSSPSVPTNPELVPRGVWCLMPKGHLKPKTEYKVIADWKSGYGTTKTTTAKRETWTFKTR